MHRAKLVVFNKELENIKNNQTETHNKISKMKNTLEGINSRLNDTEEEISELEDRVEEITDVEKKEKKKEWKEMRIVWDFWDSIKYTNVHIIGFPEGEEREKGAENIFEEIIVENFPNLGKEIDIQVKEARSPIKDAPKEEHIKTHCNQNTKIKGRVLKAAREEQ